MGFGHAGRTPIRARDEVTGGSERRHPRHPRHPVERQAVERCWSRTWTKGPNLNAIVLADHARRPREYVPGVAGFVRLDQLMTSSVANSEVRFSAAVTMARRFLCARSYASTVRKSSEHSNARIASIASLLLSLS